MKVLVTAATGFIGAHVVRALLRRGDDVTALARAGSSRARIDDVVRQIRLEEGNWEDHAIVDRVLRSARPEAIIHLAWYANPADYLVSPRNEDSLAATLALGRRAFAPGSGVRKFVGVGTCLEYLRRSELDRALRAGRGSAPDPFAEGDALGPRSIYAKSKLAASAALHAMGEKSGAEFVWGRIFHLFGPGEDPARMVPSVAAALRSGRAVDVTEGNQVRDYMHAADVGSALVGLTQPGLCGPVNVCSGQPVLLGHVLRTVGSILGSEDLLRFGGRAYGDDEEMHLAGRADVLRATGWTPRFTTLRAGLEDALRSQATQANA